MEQGIMESWNQELKKSGSEEFRDSRNHGIKDQGPGIKGFKECQGRISSIHSIGPKVAKIDLIFPIDRDKGRQAANLRNSATC